MSMDEQDLEALTLYYYNDGLSASHRRALAAKLDADPAYRRAYEQLCRTLDDVGSLDSLEVSPDKRERLLGTLDRLAGEVKDDAREHRTSGGWMLGFALAATLVVGIAIGLRIEPGVEEVDTVVTRSDDQPLVRRVTNHLRSSQKSLEDAVSRPDHDRLFLVRDIVTRNRAFADKATAEGDEQLARLLRAFEPILLELAAGEITAEDEALLRSQLLFELNIVLTKYGQAASNEPETT